MCPAGSLLLSLHPSPTTLFCLWSFLRKVSLGARCWKFVELSHSVIFIETLTCLALSLFSLKNNGTTEFFRWRGSPLQLILSNSLTLQWKEARSSELPAQAIFIHSTFTGSSIKAVSLSPPCPQHPKSVWHAWGWLSENIC